MVKHKNYAVDFFTLQIYPLPFSQNVDTTSRITLQEVKRIYTEEYKEAEDGPKVIVTIPGDEIAVDIDDDGVSLPNGWSLEPLANPKVLHSCL